ncbi:MAG: hypothetical protein K0B08_12430 [Bacteroidales bacterium]|nr:hypothetical protein [Bacteroidales bacterium]
MGGLLLGGVGVVLGGLSGKTTSVHEVSSVDLRIIINNIQNPVHLIKSLSLESANHWHALISVLIKRAEIDLKTAQSELPIPSIDRKVKMNKTEETLSRKELEEIEKKFLARRVK